MPYEYVLPAGLRIDDADAPALAECYEVRRSEGGDPPHHFVWAQVSSLRLAAVTEAALRLLPPRVRAVLEIRRNDAEIAADPEGPAADRWESPVVTLGSAVRTFRRHAAVFVHDGTVGFGAYDPESAWEVFLDDHKLLNLLAPSPDAFEALLREHGVPPADALTTVLDADHSHRSIDDLRSADPDLRRAWGRSRGADVEWVARQVRRSLRMRPQARAVGGDGAG